MINIDVNRPKINPRTFEPPTLSEGSTRIACEEIWVCLDAYDQDGITIEETEGIVIVSHIKNGGEREVIYSVKVQDP